MNIMQDIIQQLDQQYQITNVYNISDFFFLPSSTLYCELHRLRQDCFPDNYRFIFTCTDNLPDELVELFLIKLQKCLDFVDISNFFILVVTNKPWIEKFLNNLPTILNTSDPHAIQHLMVDIPETKKDFSSITTTLVEPNTICGYPWISLDIDPNGYFKPCCFYQDYITKDNNLPYHASRDSIKDVYYSKYMIQLREDFRQGKKPKSCERCWKEEESGAASKRQLVKHRFTPWGFNPNWEQDDISNLKFISLAFGNICNLKCRICSPANSSQIAQEKISNLSKENPKLHQDYKFLSSGMWIQDASSPLWADLESTDYDILFFDFAGGEPLLSKQHFKTLENLISSNRANKVSLHYNTNGTTYPSKYIHLWQHFKQVDISVSIDNIGQRAEYERSGCSWNEIQENLNRFFSIQNSKIKISMHLAVSIQNVLYLPEICDWIEQQQFNSVHFSILYWPDYLCIKNITKEAQEIILARLNTYTCSSVELTSFIDNIISIVANTSPVENLEFIRYMNQLDCWREEDFSVSHYEIAKAMNYSKTIE